MLLCSGRGATPKLGEAGGKEPAPGHRWSVCWVATPPSLARAPTGSSDRLLRHLLENPLHLLRGERPQCLSAGKAGHPDLERHCRRRLLVWPFADYNHVVAALRPIGRNEASSSLLGGLASRFGARHGLLDVLDSLIRPLDQRDVGWHGPLHSFYAPEMQKTGARH